MASTITNASLSVAITESVTLNNKAYGNTNNLTIANINEVDQRILTIPTSEVVILGYGAAVAAGTFIRANVKYLRITNKDDTNFISLHITSATDDVWVKLEAGKSYMLHNGDVGGAASFSAWGSITAVSGSADTAAVDLEYCGGLT